MKPNFILIFMLVTITIATTPTSAQEQFRRFDGSPKVEFVDKGPFKARNMRLLEDFTYTDSAGSQWTAKKGYETDGASIPQVFWSIAFSALALHLRTLRKDLRSALTEDGQMERKRPTEEQIIAV